MSALVALVLLPSIVPDLFGLGCLHHLGHGGSDGHEHVAAHGVPGDAAGPDRQHGHRSEGSASPFAPAGTHGAMPAREGHPSGSAPPCTCVGSCPTSTGPAAPATELAASLTPAGIWSRTNEPSFDQAPVLRAAYILPFANAPPLS